MKVPVPVREIPKGQPLTFVNGLCMGRFRDSTWDDGGSSAPSRASTPVPTSESVFDWSQTLEATARRAVFLTGQEHRFISFPVGFEGNPAGYDGDPAGYEPGGHPAGCEPGGERRGGAELRRRGHRVRSLGAAVQQIAGAAHQQPLDGGHRHARKMCPEHLKPVAPLRSVAPVAPVGLVGAVQPRALVELVRPVASVQPVRPGQPVEPVESVQLICHRCQKVIRVRYPQSLPSLPYDFLKEQHGPSWPGPSNSHRQTKSPIPSKTFRKDHDLKSANADSISNRMDRRQSQQQCISHRFSSFKRRALERSPKVRRQSFRRSYPNYKPPHGEMSSKAGLKGASPRPVERPPASMAEPVTEYFLDEE
eukprot:gene17782-biopygen2576